MALYSFPNDLTRDNVGDPIRRIEFIQYKQEKMLDLLNFLEQEGYTNLIGIEGRGICGLKRFVFTVGLVYGLDEEGYIGRYCFEKFSDALEALNKWDGNGHPSGDWIKHKGSNIDESNPLYVQ